METLCTTYRPAIVAWFVRQNLTRDVAEDYAHAFFARILENKALDRADPTRGRFRTFLITSVKHFYLNEIEKASAQKRGGTHRHESYDDQSSSSDSPEAAFDRDFVAILLSRALHRLQEEAVANGRGDLFRHLRRYLADPPDSDDYDVLVEALQMRRNTIAVAMHRLRKRLREIVLEELRETVASEEAFQMELDALKHSLG